VAYGAWVAASVAEEKGSRVMELLLNAATPAQMLAGKVVGTGAVGLTQYAVILGAGVLGVARRVRSETGSSGIGLGDQPRLRGSAAHRRVRVLFVLGFAFYSLLYAALGSMVSRQEDVQSAVGPLILVSTIGYMLSVFALSSIDEAWVVACSYIP